MGGRQEERTTICKPPGGVVFGVWRIDLLSAIDKQIVSSISGCFLRLRFHIIPLAEVQIVLLLS